MIASLPMYDWGDASAPHDRLWQRTRDRLRGAGIDAPEALTRDPDIWAQWTAPDLMLSQTCGLPFRTRLHERTTLVGATDCGLEGCPPGHYNSVFVVRADDPRRSVAALDGATLAHNSDDSQSGWGAARNEARRLGIAFVPGPATGAHRLSAIAVAEGRAETACIDANSWRMIERQLPEARDLRVIGRTEPTPGLPFITAFPEFAEPLFHALNEALADLDGADRDAMGIRGIVRLTPADYRAVPDVAGP